MKLHILSAVKYKFVIDTAVIYQHSSLLPSSGETHYNNISHVEWVAMHRQRDILKILLEIQKLEIKRIS